MHGRRRVRVRHATGLGEILLRLRWLIDALRSGEGIDALLARHEEVMREFRLDAVYDHED